MTSLGFFSTVWSQDDSPWENFPTLVKLNLNWKLIIKLIHTIKKFQKHSNICTNTLLQVHVWYGRYNVTRDVEAAAQTADGSDPGSQQTRITGRRVHLNRIQGSTQNWIWVSFEKEETAA